MTRNFLEYVLQHGIVVDDESDSIIASNIIKEASQLTNNTYDGIYLEGDSDNNYIEANKIMGAAGAPQPRYGINISASTCDDNIVVGNDYRPIVNFGTGAYNDAGTGTVKTYPAHATYGDNFT